LTDAVLDSSSLIAILIDEPEKADFSVFVGAAEGLVISAATLHESFCVMRNKAGKDGVRRLQILIDGLPLEILPFDVGQLEVAKDAYAEFGRGSRHKAGLNMGDCFSYALAKTLDLPLLYKGDDFVHTDIRSAL
jgi:ribonuclease VapC